MWLGSRVVLHAKRRQVRSLVGAHVGSNQPMFLSHADVSLFLPLSLKSINVLLKRRNINGKKCSGSHNIVKGVFFICQVEKITFKL